MSTDRAAVAPPTMRASGREASLKPFEMYIDASTAGARWTLWVEHLERFFRLEKITDQAEKRDILLFHVGDDARKLFNSLQDTGTMNEYGKAKDALSNYFSPQVNPDFEDFKLRQVMQKQGESIDSFHARIREASKACEYADLEQIIRSQIIYGINSEKLRRQIMAEPRVPLARILDLGRHRELADVRAASMEASLRKVKLEPHDAPAETTAVVAAVRQRQRQGYSRQPRGDERPADRTPPSICDACGEKWHRRAQCPALGQECLNCGKMNHYAVACRSREAPPHPMRAPSHTTRPKPRLRTRRQARLVSQEPPPSAEEEYDDYSDEEEEGEEPHAAANAVAARPLRIAKIRLISSLAAAVSPRPLKFRPKCIIKINENSHSTIIDTGAAVNVISKKSFLALTPRPKLLAATVILMAYGSESPLPVLGTFLAEVSYKACTVKTRFHVIDRDTETLLGCKSAIKLEVVKFAFDVTEQSISALLAKHPKLFEGIGCRKGRPIRLHIDPNVPPVADKHRRVPFHQREQVKEELELLERQGIIEKVKGPTPWVSPLVVANKPKQPDKVRLCVDMRKPNVAIKRERHITPTVDDLLAELTGCNIFSKLDLRSGYHQLPLHPKSRYITTFSSHIGLRRYKRLNFGINSAAEVFQNAIRAIIQDLPGVINVSDDILVYASSPSEHLQRLEAVLDRLEEQGLTLHAEKCEFGKHELEFFGFIFNEKGVSADPKKVQDIKSAKPPTTASAVRSFLGMANYCGRFIPHLASVSEPLRHLTKVNTRWSWSPECEAAFTGIKDSLSADSTLAYFNMQLETELLVDASPVGLGAVLTQRNVHGEVLPIAYASRALTDTEKRYSQIEKEAIAVLWGCRHFHLYVYGHPFKVFTDHKPLVPIFAGSAPHPPARIEKWMLQLQVYSFELLYRAGHDNPADFLSRHPRPATHSEELEAEETEAHVRAILEVGRPAAIDIGELARATQKDCCLQKAIEAIVSGEWKNFLRGTQKYTAESRQLMTQLFTSRQELSVSPDGVVMRSDRLVVPSEMVPRILLLAHEGHQGITKTTTRLRQRLWFPRLREQVDDMVRHCNLCAANSAPNPPEPIQNPERGSAPWESVAADFCQISPHQYLLVVVDEFSRYPEVEPVTSTATSAVTQALEKIFACHGLPAKLKTDNGPPFQGQEFKDFLLSLKITHHKITPLWPQANGDAERFMRSLNKIIRIATDQRENCITAIYRFLRSYRTTPHASTNVAPATALFKRQVRDTLPGWSNKESATIDQPAVEARRQKNNEKVSVKRGAVNSDITIGDSVLVATRHKRGKTSLTFESTPWLVVEKSGSMVTAARANEQVCRNVSLFKKVPNVMWRAQSQSVPDPNISEEDPDYDFLRGSPTSSVPETNPPASVPDEEPSSNPTLRTHPRYDLRSQPTPSCRLKDYHVYST